jgi:hypothetical protein
MTQRKRAAEAAPEFPYVLTDAESITPSRADAQALARAVFGSRFVVVHQPIGDRFRKRAPSRIRSWRAQ